MLGTSALFKVNISYFVTIVTINILKNCSHNILTNFNFLLSEEWQAVNMTIGGIIILWSYLLFKTFYFFLLNKKYVILLPNKKYIQYYYTTKLYNYYSQHNKLYDH